MERLLALGKGELDGNPYALPGLEAELLVLEHAPDPPSRQQRASTTRTGGGV